MTVGPQRDSVTSVDGALRAMAEGAVPYAGGTELIAAMKLGLLAPDRLVDLKRVADLHGIDVDAKGIVSIGSTTVHAEVAASPLIKERLYMLASATSTVGNPRVRWQGTIGGNLCFAEPRSDLLPTLIALEADVVLRSDSGERRVSLERFVIGAFTVDRADHELMTRIEVATQEITFQRYERIQFAERPVVGVALVRRGDAWRLVVGSAGYLPVLREATDLSELDPAAIAAQIDAIEDATGAADYKRHLVEVVVTSVLTRAQTSASR